MASRLLSRIAAVSLAASTLAAALPAHAASFTPGDLIKTPSVDTVYYYGQNGKRYVFPNLKTYITWYSSFDGVKTLSLDEISALPLGGNVTYRPGVKLVKVTTDPKVYAVGANGTLRWVQTEQIAKDLYGADWNTKVDDVPDAFFVNYKVGDPIVSSSGFSPSGEMARASSINADKQLNVNGPPIVSISADKTAVAAGGKATLTITATFQGSGALSGAVVKNNGSWVANCTQLPCVLQTPALASGSTNAFTAEVTDSNGLTGVSSAVTVTVPAGMYY